MDFNFFPIKIKNAIYKVDIQRLFEIRLRTGFVVKINVNGQVCYLTENGASLLKENGIVCERQDIDYVIERVTENSIYAFNEQIKKGFLTSKEGIRIGLGGDCVFDNEKIITIKNMSSLNFRIPHEVFACSKQIEKYIYNEQSVYNSLIISPPFCGKTTILKDLCFNFDIKLNKTILIIDERGEFSKVNGENIDKIRYSDKLYAFGYALRSLSPQIVVTDELSTVSDWTCAENAVNAGVKIVASIHADSINQVIDKPFFNKNVFERYFLLNSLGFFSELKAVYDKDLNQL